jgi:hypothetical protein
VELAEGRLRPALLSGLALPLIVLAAGCGGATTTVTVTRTHTVTTTHTVTKKISTPAAPCTGDQLAGTFALVTGSAGAGQVAYLLTLRNTSQSRCYVAGLPRVQLLGADGALLPTRRHTPASPLTSSGRATRRRVHASRPHGRSR